MKVISFLMVGAADAGDAEWIRVGSRISWSLIEKQREEPELRSIEISRSLERLLYHYVVKAAVRNRDKPEVIKALRSVFEDQLDPLSESDWMIGDIRTLHPVIAELRGLPPDEVNQ